eukprot:3215810-Rhodomonas_salina.1
MHSHDASEAAMRTPFAVHPLLQRHSVVVTVTALGASAIRSVLYSCFSGFATMSSTKTRCALSGQPARVGGL